VSDPIVIKGYIQGPVPKEMQEDERQQISFCQSAQDAASWTSRESAEINQHYLNRVGIEIPSATGGVHIIRDFEVEEVAPDQFIIFAHAPFIVRDGSEMKLMGNRVGNG
jgi:hypothetical protein